MNHSLRATLALAVLLLIPGFALAQEKAASDARIANALLGAPQSIVSQAAVLDWPAAEGGEFVQLRAGTNGWTCLPDLPVTEGNDPMCVDEVWLAFVKAQIAGKQPKTDRIGIGYMVHGEGRGSAKDPTATKPTPDNDWGVDGPHLMITVPDPALLKGLPTRRTNAPYVMFAGTPYAHIMVPITDHKANH